MAKIALLFTGSHPYEKEREIFEQKISYLTAEFEKVVTIPVRHREGATQTRMLPPCVDSYLVAGLRFAHPYLVAVKWLPVFK